jgi:hypothetical protein
MNVSKHSFECYTLTSVGIIVKGGKSGKAPGNRPTGTHGEVIKMEEDPAGILFTL